MPFDVYPNQASPIKVAKATKPTSAIVPTNSGPQPIDHQHAAVYPPFQQTYAQMMFIWVAVTGGVAVTGPGTPSFQLQQAGGAVTMTMTVGGSSRTVTNAAGTNLGDAWVTPSSSAANVFEIFVGFYNPPVSSPTWNLYILNNDTATDGLFTWVVADNLTETAQPWVDVAYLESNTMPPTPASTASYQVLAGDTVSDSLQVTNYGTASFDVTALSPALPGGFALGTALPQTVSTGVTISLPISFTAPGTPPMPDGVTSVTAALTTSPADSKTVHNQQFTVNAKTEQLEVVLLLDDSSSMTWAPDGTPLGATDPTSRWNELRSASSGFLDMLGNFGQNHGSFGIARFPASDPANTSSYDVVQRFTPIPSQDNMKTAKDAIAAVTPTDSTPMGDGLDHVLNPNTGYFRTDDLSKAANRRWLILMSDGANNSGMHDPMEAIAAGNGLKEKRIKMFAVAYGLINHSNVDHHLLTVLEGGSYSDADGGGQISLVDEPGTSGTDLATALKKAIMASLRELTSPSDPPAVFLAGQAEARHDVVLTPYDGKAAFAINWNTPDASRLRLELLSPGCEVITPDNAGQGQLSPVTFSGDTRFQSYYVDPEFLANPGGQPRYGTWTMVVTRPIILEVAPQAAAGAPAAAQVYENYTYDVITESALRMSLTLDRAVYYTGDRVVASARLTAAGVPVTGASVVLSTTAPAQSLANWLAGLTVPADALGQAAERLKGQDATPILVKTLGAQIAGLRFDPGTRPGNQVMTDTGGFGIYQAVYTGTSVPEHRTLYVTATGVTQDGVAFRREGKAELFVQVRPDPAVTVLTVQYGAAGAASATVFPRDAFGNILLVEPLLSGGLQLVASGAEFTGPLVSNLDGSYARPLRVTGSSPAVGVQFDGQDVIPARPLVPVADLHYVDEVIGFDAGAVAAANQHSDPRAVLGSVDGKPAGTFVSLGDAGQLTVGFRRQVVSASDGGDDITVFIEPDDDLRAYRLEAYTARHRHGGSGDDDEHQGCDHGDDDHDDDMHWVSLGESIGVTQSFGLRDAGLEYTPALRITDLSGRSRDASLNPLTTPGVSVRGVGALRTSRDRPHDLDDMPGWLARLWHDLA